MFSKKIKFNTYLIAAVILALGLSISISAVFATGTTGFCIGGDCVSSWTEMGSKIMSSTGQWTTNVNDIYYNGGNVGIGTANPGTILTLGSDLPIITTDTADGSDNKYLVLNGGGPSDGLDMARGAGILMNGNEQSKYKYGALPGGNLYLAAGNASAGGQILFYTATQRRMTMTYDGNVGIGTTDPEFKLSLDNDGGIIAKGTNDSGTVLTTTGEGTRLIWYPRKAAFRAGALWNNWGGGSNQWDDANIGKSSVAFGGNTQASGQYSVAMGTEAYATNLASIALGYELTASGSQSMALGNDVTATGEKSVVLGEYLTNNGTSSILVGKGYGDSDRLINNTATSFMVGFMNSLSDTTPELFVKDGAVGIGTTTPNAKLQVTGGDIAVTDSEKGVILKSQNGTCYRVSVNNDGTLNSASITCP
jgi:hypothetical protein